jgi:hypothetical protein
VTLILLDTNVVSELMRPRPEPRVSDWAAAQPLATLAVAAVSVMEVRFGIAVLPAGRKRDELDSKLRQFLAQGFAGRVLPLDAAAANACADIRALRKRAGRPIATEDAMIAGIARAHGATMATRDIGGFAGCGLVLVNPWQA